MGKHSEWRKLAKKARRKRIRQKVAKDRDKYEEEQRLIREQSPSYVHLLEEQRKAEEFQEEEEKRVAYEQELQWLKNEEDAHLRWVELQKKLEAAREERTRQIALIKFEWEQEQQKLKELKKKKDKEEEEKRKYLEEQKNEIDRFISGDGEIPESLKRSFETNPNKPTCPFFQKTGACRFKDSCSRNHIRPGISRVLLIRNFYSHYSLDQSEESEYGNDSCLEFENHETYGHFKEFFRDVLPEMEKSGRISQFKVCCNREIHLRGNVYVEYRSSREAIRSYQTFQGRWYGGKQINVEFCGVKSWKSAICGVFFKQRCPKGSACNFLHVFRNPENLFCNADRDLHRTPPDSNFEEDPMYESRNWRWSESPERPRRDNGLHDAEYTDKRKERTKRRSRHKRKRSRSKHRERRNLHSRSDTKKC